MNHCIPIRICKERILSFRPNLFIPGKRSYDGLMKKKKYRYEENEQLCNTIAEVAEAQREKLLEIMADSYPAESMTAISILEKDLSDDEIAVKYNNILEGLAFGRLIGTVIASQENCRDAILKLTEGSDLHMAFERLFEAWNEEIDDDTLMKFFKITLDGMVEDGIAQEGSAEKVLLN